MRLPENAATTKFLPGVVVQFFQRAADAKGAAVHDMQIDHGRCHVLMAQQLLYGSNVIVVLEQMRCERMSQGMWGPVFVDSGSEFGCAQSTLKGIRRQMMSPFDSGARVCRERRCREYVLLPIRRRRSASSGPVQTVKR
jgi:hypothetical protein